ncbi:unnamed protein product [Heligmosomoides polygyrus]|uniref:ULP_PROTEASE domain-containing protein n=1 Tax=Heligmosomoides polygyrus TaxID=6339 RepID=A0A3P8EFG2_HELPZ|nr:unnamed protein product [Heligmosomoides polygyrus]
MHENHEQGLLTRLTECFGCKLNCLANSQWKRALYQQVRDVAKYAHFLRRKCKEEEARKNSQMMCAANGTGAALAQPAVPAGRMFDAPMIPANPTLPAPDEQGFLYMGGASNALPYTSEIRDYSYTPASKNSSETSLLTQEDSAAVGVFSQESVSQVVQQSGAAPNISDTAQEQKPRPVQQYRSASEFFSAFSGLNDNDFPADFLETDPPALESTNASPAPSDAATPAGTQTEEKLKGAPQIAPQETLTLEDDDATGAPDTLCFPNGVELSLESARETLTSGSLMYGAMASFLMKHYVPVALHPAEWPERNRVFFADSDVYNVISSRCRRHGFDKNCVVTPAMAKVFQTKKGVLPPISRIVDSEITIIPLFWENHWILGVIQMFEPKERTVSGRFITVDSKYNDVINMVVLENITNRMHQDILIGLKAGLILMNKDYELAEFRRGDMEDTKPSVVLHTITRKLSHEVFS